MDQNPEARSGPVPKTGFAAGLPTWLAAADRSLSEHASSFAVLPMTALLSEDGVLPALAAQGYEVEEP